MSEGFDELGLRGDLIPAIDGAGYDRPTAIQKQSVPVLRRGGSVVIRGGTGSGALTGALLALVDRLAGEDATDGVAAIVVTATDALATRAADAAARFGAQLGVRAAAVGGGWNEVRAAVLAGTPATLLRGVQRSALKLDGARAIIIDGASQIMALGGANDLEALMQVVPRDAQRTLITAELNTDVAHFVEAHVRRAINVPARAADPGAYASPARHPDGDVGYVIAASAERMELLARLLGDTGDRRRAVVARTTAAAHEIAAGLARRGFDVGPDASDVHVVRAGERPDAELVIGYGAPLDGADFGDTFLSGDIFVIGALELTHLRQVAADANLELKPLSPSRGASPTLDAYRARIRRAMDEEDVGAQLLVLEPLFDERSPAEVAAALSALLRRRREREAPAAESASPRADSPSGKAATTAYVRLFMSAGQRDNLRPADIVGAIAGEAGVPGAQVGRIEIRDTFSVVEVPAEMADRVIRALNGTTMRGRSLRVDFDRKGGGGSGGPSAPPRRRTRPG